MFHPIVQSWFDKSFAGPTPCQIRAWPAIRNGTDVLISAPTGSGKTFAAFLSCIDELATESIQRNGLPDETRVLYVSPLKALSNDIEKNLRDPLNHINQALLDFGVAWPLNAAVRTGDTPAGERAKMVKKPPHILVTTPESLFILLTSVSGRAMLSTVRTTIVDEIHAVAANKRGAHLSLSLERLAELTGKPPLRIGLSATQNPLSRVAEFLSGKTGKENDVLIV
ncbi:MAG: ATP-dependent Lhr-like helicase, partial [Parasphingorhabdus sp.]